MKPPQPDQACTQCLPDGVIPSSKHSAINIYSIKNNRSLKRSGRGEFKAILNNEKFLANMKSRKALITQFIQNKKFDFSSQIHKYYWHKN